MGKKLTEYNALDFPFLFHDLSRLSKGGMAPHTGPWKKRLRASAEH